MPKLILRTLPVALLAQTATAQFPFRLGGVEVDYGKDLAVDTFGNIILAGYFSAVVDFDRGPAVSNLTVVGAQDNYLAKFDSQG